MSTHDLELALDMDRVLVVESGRIVFDGGAAAAVEHYRALCAVSLEVPGGRNVASADPSGSGEAR